jgi:hypothetical protein
MSLTATVVTDLVHDVIVIDFHGALTIESVPTVRRVLLKSFAQSPEAVIVNIADMQVTTRTQLVVFPTAVRIHGYPSVTLLLCGASSELAVVTGGRILGDIPIYDTYPQALAAVAWTQANARRRTTIHLAPTIYAPAHARRMIEMACEAWDINHLSDPATLVVSEFVSNAVTHARTDMDVSMALRGDYLHINVRDGSDQPPRITAGDLFTAIGSEHGRGLHLVDIYAIAWGSRTAQTGKIVWATLRATPVQI